MAQNCGAVERRAQGHTISLHVRDCRCSSNTSHLDCGNSTPSLGGRHATRYVMVYVFQAIWESRQSGNPGNLGIQAIWESRQSGNPGNLGIQAIWESRQSGNPGNLGIQAIWESRQSGNPGNLWNFRLSNCKLQIV